jgi:uncharacterized protein YegP (UPF0339 family)
VIRFQIYIGVDKKYHWRLWAVNNRIVCWSEGYDSKQGAEDSIKWVRLNSPRALLM